GGLLSGPATRSYAGAASTRTRTPASSTSTTTGPTTSTTTSGSADPIFLRLDGELAPGEPILGRSSPGASAPKARPTAKPTTAAGPKGAVVEVEQSDFIQMTSLDNLYRCWRLASKGKSNNPRIQRFDNDALRYLV